MAIFSDILLTADYDRTLTAPDSTIPQRNLEAIRYFMENGGAFTVNTGRSLPMTRVFRDKVPVNAPLLLYNGSAAYDLEAKQFSFYHEIQMDMWETIRECFELFPDLTVEVQGVDAHYCFTENPGWEAFSRCQQCDYAFAHPGDNLGPFLKFTLYGQFRDVTVADMYNGSEEERRRMALEAMAAVELADPEAVYDKYPHELSGGMLQRAMIAAAIVIKPRLLLLDEPTTALDVTIQAQILDLLKKLNRESGISMLFISHNLNVVRKLCRRVAVMQRGVLVEEGETETVFHHPQHPYTQRLVAAIPTRRRKEDQP